MFNFETILLIWFGVDNLFLFVQNIMFNFETILLISVLDDLDREKKQKDMLVGSLNAASKYTIGRGKMQKLCGLIITKNIDPDKQKMPAKVRSAQPRLFLKLLTIL